MKNRERLRGWAKDASYRESSQVNHEGDPEQDFANLGCVPVLRSIVRQMSSVPCDESRQKMVQRDFNSWQDWEPNRFGLSALFSYFKGRLSWRMMS
jgi:hypothetical protein